MKTLTQKTTLSLALLAAMGLSACNVEDQLDEETKQEINKTITGVVSSVDQLTVNDVQYDAENAKIYINGEEVAYTELKKGMVVTVSGTQSTDGTGTAVTIEADSSVDGVVSSNNVSNDGSSGSIDVLGQSVQVDAKTVFESYDPAVQSPADILPNSVVEVSGYTDGDGTVWATRVEVKSAEYNEGSEMEVEGVVTNLTETTFEIGGMTIGYTSSSFDDDFSGPLAEGQYVEVKSTMSVDVNGVLTATEVELEGEDGSLEISHDDDDEEVEVEGVVTAVISDTEIEVNGVAVYLDSIVNSNNVVLSQLTEGVFVEVEGYIDADGNFMVTELELEDDDSDSDSDSDEDDDLDGDDDDSNDINDNEIESDDD